ncbi:MAG: UDP-3-O-(3-hydroxymyristoyl)glucosamine N-acyltransferase [Epsilonproteobacteria bacterium]|nr:UDP-3-O-(3-hydroxymyristoyl)glucosamine N-acyltransferase [Campylobacterota bacterium]
MTLHSLTQQLDIVYSGRDFEVLAINTLVDAKKDEISFLDNKKYIDALKETSAGAVFIKEEFVSILPDGVEAIVCENPYLSMAYASRFFAKALIRESGESHIASTAIIQKHVYLGSGVSIGENVTILSGAYIGDDVSIGEGSTIYPNVTVYNDSKIGRNCTIHAGSVIGSDGFGYAHTHDGKHIKIYHNGAVLIEDDVEIGANSAIDRAVFGITLIKEGSKIDNLVQIGHNCEIGSHVIIVSQVGISGSSKLGRNVVMGGQSATAGHLEIGDFATIAARGGVTKSIKGGEVYSGFPLIKHKDWLRLQAKITKFFKIN